MTAAARVICVDGPNGVGKTAVARGLAARLGWRWLSVGMVYRALGLVGATSMSAPEIVVDFVRAADGVNDPVVRVGDQTFTEGKLAGSRTANAAASLGASAAWQTRVNAALRGALRDGGLVVEGRAAREIFPEALLAVYLWADRAERARRTAAVDGSALDPARESGDRHRALEALRVRPGALVWNSTRFTMGTTVATLAERVAIASGERRFTLAVSGLEREVLRDGVRCVPYGALDADAHLVTPRGTEPGTALRSAVAHADVLVAGSDIVSVGTIRGASPTQPLMDATRWPANRWLSSDWLLQHRHFAVPRQVVELCRDPTGALPTLTAPSATVSPGSDVDRVLRGAWWIPQRLAVVPAVDVLPPRQFQGRLAQALHLAQSDPESASLADVRVSRGLEPRTALWFLAAMPESLLSISGEEG
ncbi:(d)CMP kinase [Streptomyces hainanensis]|uniref:(d)CMP kinase n=1 Tax=Streptomyces hainanensis TaxID=402648 RepID=UPI001404F308|nr:(d)CMP kinase [Streptomyces hainanensis]